MQKIWKHPISLWHWSVTWPWFAVLCLGGLGFIAVNEPVVGLVLLFLSFFSLSAKLWHTTGSGLLVKILGTVGIVAAMVLCTMGAVAYMEERPWSNIVTFWRRYVVLKHMSTVKFPQYPPKLEDFPSTTVPIPVHEPSTTKKQPPVIIQTGPSFGDLKDRAIKLADEVMCDMYTYGWNNGRRASFSCSPAAQMPSHWPEIGDWEQRRANHFIGTKTLEKVVNLRNAFAALNYEEERLDRMLVPEFAEEHESKLTVIPFEKLFGKNLPPPRFGGFQAEQIAEGLRALAKRLP
jgi:hypothetical protein